MEFKVDDRVKSNVKVGTLEPGDVGSIKDVLGDGFFKIKFDKFESTCIFFKTSIEIIRDDFNNHTHTGAPTKQTNKYKRKISEIPIGGKYVVTIEIDIYDVLKAWNVTNPAIQHAIKKLLQPGDRGHKDKLTDLREASKSIDRGIELES